jgi:hypothetical protein
MRLVAFGLIDMELGKIAVPVPHLEVGNRRRCLDAAYIHSLGIHQIVAIQPLDALVRGMVLAHDVQSLLEVIIQTGIGLLAYAWITLGK